ncbi:polyprenyl diphosphate synthase [Acholeplasma granularum]|uniref:polyprenyl diphosphate synthase n=1 Tax=Acholeplasma granularum TaxID=264635 RepID=UPI0004B53678|nr:polyprenyl diphosphate synthase [Acholeplasma granularum]
MNNNKLPNHVAIILDGNGRWAKKYKLPRSAGHYRGGMNLAKIAEHANKIGIKELSVYAFSTENWVRPQEEVDYLMTKPIEIVNENLDRIINANIKLVFKGRKDRLKKDILDLMDKLENDTRNFSGMILNVCIDYGSYDEILTAIGKMKENTLEAFNENLMVKNPVDFLIRTGGEIRLSNFLLWQIAYAELYFTKRYWPSFRPKDFDKALKEFSKRQRRFGGIKS